MIRAFMAIFLMGLAFAGPSLRAQTTIEILSFQDLDGWHKDDHAAALRVFQNTCPDMKGVDWQTLCGLAFHIKNPKAFFELFFRPVLQTDGTRALFTGYFEPEINGSLSPSARYRYPLYRMPPEAKNSRVWKTRTEIETTDIMKGRGLEIAWVDDPVDLFFLQIQGSGRIKLPDGRRLRVGYGGSNGHSYRSVGVELVRRGIYKSHQVSAQVIKSWVKRNPVDGAALLRHNPSYVFFRPVPSVRPSEGPLGAMNRSITAQRSIAVDPAHTTLGTPVWIEKAGAAPMHRLMVAQDTGSAIKGIQRADIFMGTGPKAGRLAGQLKDGGRMIQLLPIQRAYGLLPEVVQ